MNTENMVEIAISDLKGQALNWLIHWIEGVELHAHMHHGKLVWVTVDQHGFPMQWHGFHPYCTDWAHGGPLVDKYAVMFVPTSKGFEAMADGNIWNPSEESASETGDPFGEGETALLAICRAIVANEFPDPLDIVKVPAELIQESSHG